MASQVDICNLALTAIGHKTIANIEEQTEAARKCKVYYQPVVDETLRAYNWNCATARALYSRGISPKNCILSSYAMTFAPRKAPSPTRR